MRSAWIDLLMFANHEDKQIIFDYKPIIVKRGQYLTSVRKLSARWKWDKERTLKYLRLLEQLGMITKDSNNRRTLLTIENYEKYQDWQDTEPPTTPHTRRTQDGHSTATNNNENNENNENNKYSSSFVTFWDCYPKKSDKGQAYKCYKARLNDGWSEEEFVVVHYEELFVKDSKGNILCYNPNTYESYLYDGKSMTKQFQIQMEDGMPDMPTPNIGKVFYPDGKILVNYFYTKRGAYNRFGNMAIFDKDYNLIVEGVGGLREGEAPFLPILQKGNQLITVLATDDAVGAVVPGRSIQAQIVFHSMK